MGDVVVNDSPICLADAFSQQLGHIAKITHLAIAGWLSTSAVVYLNTSVS